MEYELCVVVKTIEYVISILIIEMIRQESKSYPEKERTVAKPALQRQTSARKNPSADNFFVDDVYEYILDHGVIKRITIPEVSAELQSPGRSYTVYLIKVDTDGFDFFIKRRYNEFFTLYQTIMLRYKDIKLPPFPEKKWFGSMDTKTIVKRKRELNELMEVLLANVKRLSIYEFLEFLQIREEFKKRGIVNIKRSNLSGDMLSVQEIKKYTPQNEEEHVAFKYIQRLNDTQEQRVKLFQQMEKNLLSRMQKMSLQMIQLMLIGEVESQLQGILQILAPASQEHVSCVHGFKFLRMIFEFEYNPYAEVALKAFCEISFKQVKMIKAASHIGGQNQNCKNDALFVLHKYFERNGMNDQFIRFMLEDEDAQQEYFSYKQKKSSSTNKFRIKTDGDLPNSFEENKFDPDNRMPSTRRSPQQQTLTNSVQSNIGTYLDQPPNTDELLRVTKLSDVKWKCVIDNERYTLKHIMGRIGKMKHKNLETTLERATSLFSDQLHEWNDIYYSYEVLSQPSQTQRIVLIKQVLRKASQVKIIASIQTEDVMLMDDRIVIKSNPASGLSEYQRLIAKDEEKGLFCSVLKFKQAGPDRVHVSVLLHVFDSNSQILVSKVLLNEDNDFHKYNERLGKIIASK